MEAGRCSNPSGSGAPGRAGLSGAHSARAPGLPAPSHQPAPVSRGAWPPSRSAPGRQRREGPSAGSRESTSLRSSEPPGPRGAWAGRPASPLLAVSRRPAEMTHGVESAASLLSQCCGRLGLGERRGQWPHFFTPWRPLVVSVPSSLNWGQ